MSGFPGDELRLAAAMKLYELGRLSSGAAAARAGVPRVEFLSRLGEYGVDTSASVKMTSGRRRALPEVVSNTSPLQYLHQLGLLDLLP